MPPAEFEPKIMISGLPQNLALDGAANEIGIA
jgi:hypothetical protein